MKKLIGLALTSISLFLFLLNFPTANYIKDVKAATSTLSLYSEKNKIGLINKDIKEQDEFIDINLSIPIIQGIKDENLQDKLNKDIEEYIYSLRKEVKDKYKEDSLFAEEKGYSLPKYEVKSNYMITYEDENILSFTITTYKYTGGTYGITNKKSYNIDLKYERILQLQDLFKENEDFQTVINKKLNEDIIKNKNLYNKNSIYSINYDQPFYLQDRNIIIYFPMNEISVYTLGIPEFKIPFDNFYNGVDLGSLNKYEKPKITTKEINEHSKYINLNVKFPEIDLTNSDFNKKINEYVENNIFSFVKSLENEAKNAEKSSIKNTGIFIPYSVNISYTILQNNKWNIIIGIVKSHFDGNSFKTTDSIINIDLKTGTISE
ncbi:DUF4163 domain-containing protein [Clostridium sp.]|uniref:PdaC/SigV domain-containing protein n=1 Tax=Clostridium sp. TaxID=1506 RepID=UPI002FCA9889